MTPLKGAKILGVRKGTYGGYLVDYRIDDYKAYNDEADGWEDNSGANYYDNLDYHAWMIEGAVDELDAMTKFMEAWNKRKVRYS